MSSSINDSTDTCKSQCGQQAFAALRKAWDLDFRRKQIITEARPLKVPSINRRRQSLDETPYNTAEICENVTCPSPGAGKNDTVLYLAYGSNLSAETFKGVRGIEPLGQINVSVPELELTFDLPGIPYKEPCFANTKYRAPAELASSYNPDDYHKIRWHKGLVGVVYEVTKADYATIIATEGGGASYHDILVECYEIPAGSNIVNTQLGSKPFKAHTLFSPQESRSLKRPDPNYAQASARYLKLITDGAEEHNLPGEYQDYLHDLRPYTLTSIRQRIGQTIFLGLWAPFIETFFALSRIFADDKGRIPKWLVILSNSMFAAIWASYDGLFKKVFGDGERTQKTPAKEYDIGRWSEKKALLPICHRGNATG